MIATVRSATILGARGHPVSVEVHVAKGIPGFSMLGLPDESCREARDRVRAAIITSAVSLLIFGLTLLMQQGFDNLLSAWEGGVEMMPALGCSEDRGSDATNRRRAANGSNGVVSASIAASTARCALARST